MAASPTDHSHAHNSDGHSSTPFSAGSSTRVLSIASGKGGVGKSSVAVNLAVALAQAGHSVSILDADVYGFSVPAMLGIDWAPEVIDHHMLVPPVNHGVGCISMGFFLDDNQPLMWRGPMLQKALNQFLTDVVWGQPEYLILDTPPGTGDVAMAIAQLLPTAETYVVTTPQPAARRVAQRSGAMAKEAKTPLMGIIENMSSTQDSSLFGHGGGSALADHFSVPLLAQIPVSEELRVAGDTGVPIAVAHPHSAPAEAFASLAQSIHALRPPRIYHQELKIS